MATSYFRCGECGEPIRVTDVAAGESVACPHCGRANICAPSASPAPSPVEAPPVRHLPIARIAAGIAAVSALAWAAWALVDASRADRPVSASSPIEARQKALLKADLGQPGDPELMRQYGEINARYFAGRLPATPVMWEPGLADIGALGPRPFTLEGMFGHIGSRTAILINDHLKSDPAALARALCHEMVHAYLYEIGDRTTDHGPAFQAELKRLADGGAFTGVVASDDERRALKAWLDGENARIDTEEDAIRRDGDDIARERADLESAVSQMDARFRGNAADGGRPSPAEIAGLNARRDAFNSRVEAARDRAEAARVSLADFNREVERYNLMLVYPDGLDDARVMATRASTAP